MKMEILNQMKIHKVYFRILHVNREKRQNTFKYASIHFKLKRLITFRETFRAVRN